MTDDTLKRSLAASVGAVLTSLVVTPLEVVKTRLQVQVPNVAKVSHAARTCPYYNFSNGLMDTMLPKESLLKKCKCSPEQLITSSPRPNSVLYTMARIVRLEGPLALYAGLPPTLLLAVPSTAMYFTSYEMLMTKGKDAFPNVNPGLMAMFSGSLARAGAATVFSPLELIRVQMQSGETTLSFATHFREAAKGGTRQLYRGLGATLARDIPFSALYWFGIETSKAYLNNNGGGIDKIENPQWRQVTIAFVAGVLAGTFATVATHPFDVVKTRKQLSIYSPAADSAGASLSSRAMLAQVWRQEGLAGLSAGLMPRAVKVAPACAIMISTYEAAKIAFEKSSQSTSREWL